MHVLLIFRGGSRFCSFFIKFERIFPGISQNFNTFGKRDVKIFIFQKNLRNFAEILQNSDTKLLKIRLKKMYALNVFGGKVAYAVTVLRIEAVRLHCSAILCSFI